MLVNQLSSSSFHLSDTNFQAVVLCLQKLDLFFSLEQATFEHLVLFELNFLAPLSLSSEFLKVMNQLFIFSLHLILSFLVSSCHNLEFLQKLFIEVLNLIIFLAGNCLLVFKLSVEESV